MELSACRRGCLVDAIYVRHPRMVTTPVRHVLQKEGLKYNRFKLSDTNYLLGLVYFYICMLTSLRYHTN